MRTPQPDLALGDVIRLAGSAHRYFAAGRAALALHDGDHEHPMVRAFWDVAFRKVEEAEDQFFGSVGAPIGTSPAGCTQYAEALARCFEFGAGLAVALSAQGPPSLAFFDEAALLPDVDDPTWTPVGGAMTTWLTLPADDDDEPEILWAPRDVAP